MHGYAIDERPAEYIDKSREGQGIDPPGGIYNNFNPGFNNHPGWFGLYCQVIAYKNHIYTFNNSVGTDSTVIFGLCIHEEAKVCIT
jgi:hypothetical protein